MLKQHSGYLDGAFVDSLDDHVAAFRQCIANEHTPKFDTIVGTGLSGALIVPTLGRALGLNWAIVRKQGDSDHASRRVEGQIGDQWVFVDDLIASGRTLTRVVDAVKEAFTDWERRRVDDAAYYRSAIAPERATTKFVGTVVYGGYRDPEVEFVDCHGWGKGVDQMVDRLWPPVHRLRDSRGRFLSTRIKDTTPETSDWGTAATRTRAGVECSCMACRNALAGLGI